MSAIKRFRKPGRLVKNCTPPFLLKLFRKIQENRNFHLAKNRLAGQTKLHLACGSNILDGWANIDLSERNGVIKHDLTKPLPVQSETIQFIFNEHFLEHITQDQARALLTECYRVLMANGTLRINTPDLKKLIAAYLTARISEWIDVGWSPSTPCRLMNEGMRLWEHKFVYDVKELESLLKECGFRKLSFVAWRESSHSELKNLECRPFHGEIVIEAKK